MAETRTQSHIARPPIIAVLGHIDHGKSTLLDYIRKTNVVEGEAGGITQHLSAYEVVHKDERGVLRRITFLDTPGHEAFQKMRLRGAEVADIAILIVSAEEGVKAQTLEAHASIKEAGIPLIVAINKIDKPNADVERTKANLLENEIYLEGLGGDVPWVPISAKVGTGVSDLLDMMLLVADMEELSGDPSKLAEGVVIEAHRDPRKGISATLIITDGTLKSGMCVVSGGSMSPVRIFEDFQGNVIKEATFSSPVRVVGWSDLPQTGDAFHTYEKKKEAEARARESAKKNNLPREENIGEDSEKATLYLILKTDVAGSIEAIEHEIQKLESDEVSICIVQKGVGDISESDIKAASGHERALVVGFQTGVDRIAQDLADRNDVEIHMFDVIYKLSEWLEEMIEKQKKTENVPFVEARIIILKCFSSHKGKQVVGGRVESGTLRVKRAFRIMRGDEKIGTGTVRNLQTQKANVTDVSEGAEFGAELLSETELAVGDIIETHTSRT